MSLLPVGFSTVALAALIIAVSAALQAVVGFGSGMVAIPLLTIMGMELPAAVAMSTTAMTVQMALGLWAVRAEVRIRPLLPFALLFLLGTAAGTWGLRRIADVDPALMKQLVGGALLLAVGLLALARPAPRPKHQMGWGILAVTSSGVLTGLTGMGGGPLVLWVVSHDWSPDRLRGTVWALLLPRLPVQLALLYAAFGDPILWSALLGAAATPVAYLGTRIGHQVGRRVDRRQLRRLALVALCVVAVVAVVGPLAGR